MLFLFLAVIFCLFALPMFGKTFYLPFRSPMYYLRFDRTVLALLAGGGLALGGLVFQALFRNPLATPYTLGVASGASLGAAIALKFFVSAGSTLTLFGISIGITAELPWVSLGAFTGAALSMLLVYLLGSSRDSSSNQMLLAGVAVNFFFAGLIVLIQYLSARHDALQILRWTMGGVQNAQRSDWIFLAPIVFAFFLFLLFLSRELNIIVTGNSRAQSLGIDMFRLRNILFFSVTLMLGAAVAVCGPIGFVGLVVPHIARLLVGANHQRLVPVSFLGGGIFLAVCDTLGRIAVYPTELPVGIITGLLGGPFFLWLLLRAEQRLG
ncbi:MAG: iron ABC transporter permease [Planctomycetaceae bacterium]|nr:iron ABC transporter permease [Planctomycetaceae bacterium]